MDPVIELVICCALALLWFTAAIKKTFVFEGFITTLRNYQLVPKSMLVPFSAALVGMELCFSIGVVLPFTRSFFLLSSAGLFGMYAAAIGINLRRGRRHIDCGCMGLAQQSLSGWLVWRNLLLAGLALACLLPVHSREFLWLDSVSIIFAVGALAAVYATVNRLIANVPELARLRR